jgi:ribosomal protection tetracycline resistance protein
MTRTLNLGILAHVDAGKTTLTERLLYNAGVIDEIGRVDDGTTQTDTLELERRRGITIRSAVVSFGLPGPHGDVTVNLIDTPGHPDFIAEVERVLHVLDGAVLVISAVEGVQAQTRVLMRTLQRLRIPTLLFVNKIDRLGARADELTGEIRTKLDVDVVPMGAATGLGTRDASVMAYTRDDRTFVDRMSDVLATHDDALLSELVADAGAMSSHRLRCELVAQTRTAAVHPLFFGSAVTGAGVADVMAGLTEFLPAPDVGEDGPLSGSVFKVERGPAGERVAYVRMYSGVLHARDRIDAHDKVTAIRVFDHGDAVQRDSVPAGRIAKVWGLSDIRIGDTLGVPSSRALQHAFAPPTLETVIVPCPPTDKGTLHAALAQLAEQDPLIDLRQDDVRGELFVSLYGEVQKEVIRDTLAADYGLDVSFRETSVICIERPRGIGEGLELIGKRHNPYLATIGLRVEPAPVGSGIDVRFDVDVRTIPLYVYNTVDVFRDAMAQHVRTTLRHGLAGWEVRDCIVTMTRSDYMSPGTKARHVRKLTPVVLMSALKAAGTIVCEPIHRFGMECPVETLHTVLSALGRLGATPHETAATAETATIHGEVAATRMHELQLSLRSLTRGEGVLEFGFSRYDDVTGDPPTRPRPVPDPLDRVQYFRDVPK